ncbi:DeoR/GlpR family DNA-binding transcription regulator [Salipiger mangrovisoli]|uniref:DeoR/GlpR transcriptional regulator n=1 Tax=Salipiger mangrovisoli TaxID=2865933 RepID=A0ABR9X1I4_9RHOB|nr:DeoR/GlpR family DNA-binding transcription regulator [Salipiger mangrovisoli]MBE9637366.1 DeoR/GlpR transcriptional regulator [Salipiger mangrovisoli]
MSESHRHHVITTLLEERPFVSVKELQLMLRVSAATVRRDIDKLDEAGAARKVHGGLAAPEGGPRRKTVSLPFVENRDIAVEAKRAIATEASKLVRDGSLIIVHGGSTCFEFGTRIANRNVRVFTNSMPLAGYLSEHGTCQLTVGGGDLHREPGILYDPARGGYEFYASQFFVGALGVSQEGLLENHPLLVRFINDMCGLANEIIVLVDSRKFAERPSSVALPLSRVTRLITDDGLSDRDAAMLEDEGVAFSIAATSGAAP